MSNYIDVFHEEFTEDKTKHLFVDKCSIKNFSIEGVAVEVNTIECRNLILDTFLANNGINIMASCILVDFLSVEMKASLYSSLCFWTFLFQDHADRKIQPVNTINTDKYEANTCISISYKAFQLEEYLVEFYISNIDPTKGIIAVSGKEKFYQMKDRPERPFHEYQCIKHSSHFFISKKYKKLNYAAAQCNSW